MLIVIFGAVALGQSAFSNSLPFGPGFLVESNGQQDTIVVPTQIESIGVRLGWGFSVALKFFAGGLAFLTFGQVGRRVPGVPLFSSEMRGFLTIRWTLFVLTFVAAEFIQTFLAGPVGDAAGLVDASAVSGEFGPIASPVIWASVILGWVAKQGAAVQAETEDIV